MLDGSEREHPAGVGGEHPQLPAEVGSLTHTGLHDNPVTPVLTIK